MEGRTILDWLTDSVRANDLSPATQWTNKCRNQSKPHAMSESPSHKSHAMHWIIGVVLAVVLYLGSAHPVCALSFQAGGFGTTLPRFILIQKTSIYAVASEFYVPAFWVWEEFCPLILRESWEHLWGYPIFSIGSRKF